MLALPPHHIAGLQVVARAVGDGREVVVVEGRVDAPAVAAAVDEAVNRHNDGRVAISVVLPSCRGSSTTRLGRRP
ncbi:O-succinylbenzoic acid-CoA ligase [Cutibacterium acnes JCM 18909]|nr:O-succinylbenzoic acid-CoA ligase [Cutibacterium acnes JCM 18909]